MFEIFIIKKMYFVLFVRDCLIPLITIIVIGGKELLNYLNRFVSKKVLPCITNL